MSCYCVLVAFYLPGYVIGRRSLKFWCQDSAWREEKVHRFVADVVCLFLGFPDKLYVCPPFTEHGDRCDTENASARCQPITPTNRDRRFIQSLLCRQHGTSAQLQYSTNKYGTVYHSEYTLITGRSALAFKTRTSCICVN